MRGESAFWIILAMLLLGLVYAGMASLTGPLWQYQVLVFGLALTVPGTSAIVYGKLIAQRFEARRGIALGAGTAAGSFGQFLFAPFGVALIDNFGWQTALVVFSALMLLILPLSLALATPPAATKDVAPADQQSFRTALAEAFGHRSYVLLVLGFFTCGFQLAFITVHMPAYLKDMNLPAWVGAWTLGVIGLANAVGSLSSGWLSTRMPKRHLLAWIYFGRAAAIAVFILLPPSPGTSIAFGIVIGLFWLSTVPPTSALVMLMFGTKYMAMLYGFAFFSHQVGGFLGVWLGGLLYEAFGSYIVVWWLSIALGIASALINLPIVEKPVERGLPQPA